MALRNLVRACVAGDTAAFSTLVERYQRVLYTVAVRMLGDPASLLIEG